MPSARAMDCCGWKEITNLRDYTKRGGLVGLCKNLYRLGYLNTTIGSAMRCGAILFTAAGVRPAYANAFKREIERRNLGTVQELPKFVNPNTARTIHSYVWYVNQDTMRQFINENFEAITGL